ncbi:6515_t:CDS:10 [Paraglomus brasilianum]|uniref:6515_t:CDS:1 n=1 Tax=Paraglomus brasilianum TaxID=144538 RepID=A0A9N9FI53_9GLOM|nr:6515_t:CDS:10 [Paraglomus brasilianum]
MERKRSRTANLLGEEDDQPSTKQIEAKKHKSNGENMRNFLPSLSDPVPNPGGAPRPEEIQAIIAQKRAEIAAKLATFSKQTQQKPVAPQTMPSALVPPAAPVAPVTSSGIDPDLQRKIQEAKERIKSTIMKTNPYLSSPSSAARAADDSSKAKGGLKVEAHPALLLDQSGKLDIKRAAALIPKPNFATIKANQRATPAAFKQETKVTARAEDLNDITQSEYFDSNIGTIAPKRRLRKRFKFVQKGKFEALGNQMRAQAKLEKLKEEIAQNVKKAGIEAELDSDKAIKRKPPPTVEWWDVPLLSHRTYDDIDAGVVKIESEDSLVTMYVQHPVPIKPPGDHGPPPPKPLMLTKKEQKKLRRQRRLELQKEKQDKIRLGLLPPDQPKVKLSNLMRVLTNDAIQDPTKVEAQVRKEMQKRQETHLKTNEERKLTEEQKREKLRRKMDDDAKKGTFVCAFKVGDLSHPKMKFKVDRNAQQLGLTGCVMINPSFNIVVVEGGPKSIKFYKKLMLRRIDWSDTTRLGEGSEEMVDDEPKETQKINKCSLIWEGVVKDRAFKGFKFKTCPTENTAREHLRKYKVEHYWDLASKYNDDGPETSVIV